MNIAVALAIPVLVFLLLAVLSRESDIDVAVKRTKILDARLVQEFSAKGETFEEHINSAKGLPKDLVNTLHDIRKMRNDVVHVVGHDHLPSRRKFIQICDYVEAEFDRLNPPRRASNPAWGCLLISSILVAFAYLFSQYAG